MSSLYRKYRPQTWAELIGQEPIKLTLQKELETGKLAHAYLFSGPRGTGKTTAARLLAKSLNCAERKEGESEPCNHCASCQEISRGQSIDVLEIDAASHTGVDNVRENIIDSARFLPTKSRYKIFIIDEAHMLSVSAFNALLKTLEEPPPHVFFILATTEPHKLPVTILSRCQRFDFKKINLDNIVPHLNGIGQKEGFKIEKQVLERVGRLSEGCLRDAESLLEQLFSLGEKNITEKEASLILPRSDFHQVLNLLALTLNKDLKEAIKFLNELVEEGVDVPIFTDELIALLRVSLMVKTAQVTAKSAFDLDEASLKKINDLVKSTTPSQLVKIIDLFLKQRAFLRSSPIPQLPLEIALVELCNTNNTNLDTNINTNNNDDVKPTMPPAKKTVHPVKPPSDFVISSDPDGASEESRNPSLVKLKDSSTPSPEARSVGMTGDGIDKSEILTQNNKEIAEENLGALADIKDKWLLFLKKVQDYNHSLPFILKMGEPTKVCGRKVHITFKFTFHRDKLNEPKIRALAEKALNEVVGGDNLCIESCYSENINIGNDKIPETRGNDDLVSVLAKSFGGQVIE